MSGIDSDLIRGHIDTIILKTLFDGDKYGYEILDEVAKKSDGAYELKQPTLYSCLKRLENQGLISSYWVDSEIGGKRHYYCLTEQGKETYMENQRNWLRSRQIIDNLIWENAPTTKQPVVPEINNNDENNIVSQDEIIPEPVIDYIPPTLENSEVSSDENTENNEDDSTSTLLEMIDDIQNSKLDDEIDNVEDNNQNEDIDIMSLLGHIPQETSNEVDEHIEEFNSASQDLNDITENNSSNNFLENFVKNYMSSDEVEQNNNNEIEEQNNQEFDDDFNLDLSSHFDSDDSYFSSVDTKDKIDFITPNVIIDGLQSNASDNFSDESSHIEFIEDDLSVSNTNDEYTETPKYVSFGEEIVRKQEEPITYSSYENESIYEESNSDLDSLYESPTVKENYNTYDDFSSTDETNVEGNIVEEFNNTQSESISEITYEPTVFDNEKQTIYRPTYEAKGFEVVPSKYTDNESKKKITELTTFAKESSLTEEIEKQEDLFNTNDFLERNKVTKNYDKLIADFEKEGLSVRVHSRLVKEARETRTYVETNKIKMTRNWISFCFISAILAIVFAIMHTNGINYYAFSYKYFVIGILIAMVVPITSTIIYALNPYKKHTATFSAGVSFMLSALVFVQLLLIIYCVNLQLGFYSFSQEYYNHLYWIIPMIISIYPILNSIVYTTLYKSKNFHS